MTRWVPLITGGGARSSSRPPGLPTPAMGAPANAVPWFEDFNTATVGSSLAGGHPQWVHTVTGTGTAGIAGGSTAANIRSYGVLNITTSATSGHGSVIDPGQRSTTTGTFLSTGSTINANFMIRFVTAGSVANLNFGFGLVPSSLATGTNWITDPNVTLLGATTGASSIVFTYHAAGYGSGAGSSAGNLTARYYEASDTFNSTLLMSSSIATSTAYKLEGAWTGTGWALYFNGALVGTIADTSGTSSNFRPSFGAYATSAASRSIGVDLYYQEQGFSAAR